MANITSLPDELLLQILSHNVPHRLHSRLDFSAYITSHAYSHRFLRLARDSFFHTFVHDIALNFTTANLTRNKIFTQVHTSGAFFGKKSFTRQVRRLRVRMCVYYLESVGVAMEELRGVLEGYGRLGCVAVRVETTSARVAEVIGGKVEEVLDRVVGIGGGGDGERQRGASRRVKVLCRS